MCQSAILTSLCKNMWNACLLNGLLRASFPDRSKTVAVYTRSSRYIIRVKNQQKKTVFSRIHRAELNISAARSSLKWALTPWNWAFQYQISAEMNAFLANTDVYLKNFRRRVFSQNALSQKCIFAKVHFRKGVFSQYSVFAKVYFRNSAGLRKCTFAEVYFRNNALSQKYNWYSLQKQSIFYELKMLLSTEAIDSLQKILRMKSDALCRSNQSFTN